MRRVIVFAMFGVLCAGVVHADVTTEDKSQVKFAGILGRMVNLFGGRATRDGIVSTVAVRGDRMARRTDQTELIVDLKEERIPLAGTQHDEKHHGAAKHAKQIACKPPGRDEAEIGQIGKALGQSRAAPTSRVQR